VRRRLVRRQAVRDCAERGRDLHRGEHQSPVVDRIAVRSSSMAWRSSRRSQSFARPDLAHRHRGDPILARQLGQASFERRSTIIARTMPLGLIIPSARGSAPPSCSARTRCPAKGAGARRRRGGAGRRGPWHAWPHQRLRARDRRRRPDRARSRLQCEHDGRTGGFSTGHYGRPGRACTRSKSSSPGGSTWMRTSFVLSPGFRHQALAEAGHAHLGRSTRRRSGPRLLLDKRAPVGHFPAPSRGICHGEERYYR
jgi:hypothetical protein